jgi:uncharacterized membrane protein YbhN (UPF0104 family)
MPVPQAPDETAAELTDTTQRRRLRNGVIGLALLMVLGVSLLLAVPGLRGVADGISDMPPGDVAGAIGLELASCFGFVFAFWLVFWRAPFVFAARVAWTEMAFGSAVSLGGAGSIAIGAWLLAARGLPASLIAKRSTVLFLLTSAINVIVLTLAGALLALGVLPGPSNPLLSVLPAGVGVVTLVFFLLLPTLIDRRSPRGRLGLVLRGLAESVRETEQLLLTPDWRLLGAIAYLACDIAVLGLCFDATGHQPPLASLVLGYQIGYITNIIPVPGGIGVLDAGLVGMLILYGAKATPAAAAVFAYHAIVLWVPALIGSVAFIRLQRAEARRKALGA